MTQNSINNSASSFTTGVIDVDNINIDGNTIKSTDTNGDIIIAPDGSGTVYITSSPIVPSTDRSDSLGSATNSWDNVYCNGVSFDDGTNILKTYTENTSFTPTVSFNGNDVGVTYGSRYGTLTRIGNLVWFTINIALTSKGTSVGRCEIGGLPFLPNNNHSIFPFRSSFITLAAPSGKSYFVAVLTSASGKILLQEVKTANEYLNILNTAVSNTSEFLVSGMYSIVT